MAAIAVQWLMVDRWTIAGIELAITSNGNAGGINQQQVAADFNGTTLVKRGALMRAIVELIERKQMD